MPHLFLPGKKPKYLNGEKVPHFLFCAPINSSLYSTNMGTHRVKVDHQYNKHVPSYCLS